MSVNSVNSNATRIRGTPVDPSAIADGKALVYNSTTGKIEYQTVAATVDLTPYLLIATAASTYAPLASPTFTGLPWAGGNFKVGGVGGLGGTIDFYDPANDDYISMYLNDRTLTFSENMDAFFGGAVSGSNLSGTNTGNVTISSANGLSIVGQALSMALASSGGTGTITSTSFNTLLGNQAPNYVYAGPTSGGAGATSWRALVASDLPTVTVAKGGTGLTTFGGTNRLLYTTATDTLSSIVTANSAILGTNGSGVPSWMGTLPAVDGSLLTNLNGSNISSGSIDDGFISSANIWNATTATVDAATSSPDGDTLAKRDVLGGIEFAIVNATLIDAPTIQGTSHTGTSAQFTSTVRALNTQIGAGTYGIKIDDGDGLDLFTVSQVGHLIAPSGNIATLGSTSFSLSQSLLGIVPADGILVSNTSSATAGATVQMSPRIRLKGSAWKSNATAASQTQDWVIQNLPATGAASTSSTLQIGYSNNGAAYSYPLTIATDGLVTASTFSTTSVAATSVAITGNSGSASNKMSITATLSAAAGGNNGLLVSPTFSNSSLSNNGIYINPTVNTTSTGGVSALKINLLGTLSGSGAEYLIEGQTASANVFTVNQVGTATFGTSSSTATATPVFLDMGGTYGTNAAGNSGNLKFKLYSAGVSYGIGMSSNLMEYQVPTGATHGFYVNSAIATTVSSTGLSVVGDIYSSSMRIYNFDRTIPTTVGNSVDLGTYTVTNGGSNMELWLTVASSGYAQSKRYFFPTRYHGTANTWRKVEAISSTGAYSGSGLQDVDLEILINNASVSLRLRRTSGTTAGTAKISFAYQGYASTDTWTPSTTSGTATAPTARYEVFADAMLTTISQIGNFATGTTGSYSIYSWNATGNPLRLMSMTPTNNGGASPAVTEPALVLARTGVGGVAYDNYAEVKIGRYEHASVNARTKIDFALTHGSGDAAGTNVFGIYSSGRIQVPVSTTPASASAAGNAGDITWDSSYIYVCTAASTWKRAAISTW